MSKCAKCNKEFECCAKLPKECWCNEVKLSKEQLVDLSQEFKTCLCPDCLKGIERSTLPLDHQ